MAAPSYNAAGKYGGGPTGWRGGNSRESGGQTSGSPNHRQNAENGNDSDDMRHKAPKIVVFTDSRRKRDCISLKIKL